MTFRSRARGLALVAACVCLIIGTFAAAVAQRAGAHAGADPFLWLEDVNGARARSWVRAEDARTLAVLRSDPHFARFQAQALAINAAKDRIPLPDIIGGRVYNFWQDAKHVRGIWRTTTIAGYASSAPAWTTVLDLDELARAEGQNWVWQGADCDSPSRRRCLIALSDGGEDASSVREFDLATRRFVRGGFALPRGKQQAVWAGDDALLIAREWRPGELTASGYPYVVKRLRRGQALSAAVELTRGTKADVGVSPIEFHDGSGHRALIVHRGLSFFEAEQLLVTPRGLVRLDIPRKAEFVTLAAGRLLLHLNEPWRTGGAAFPQGALISFDLAAADFDPARLEPMLVYAPGPRETFDNAAGTRDRLLVTTYENVRGRASIYTPAAHGGWARRPLRFADDSSLDIVSTDEFGSTAFVSVTSFLIPTTLWRIDTRSRAAVVAKSLPPRFDATADLVEQSEAISKDGTRIPYFIVRPKRLRADGRNPTLLHAYGGFGISMTPEYSGTLGKLWLANGGVYVLANIRGGGEFGPAWHEAGLKTHRQRVFDDFTAVADDLIAKKITSPRYLGIQGGSNGGLLMGVELTQHPELWHAVDIQVPLLDMLRFEKIQAGASWVGEYGSVAIPRERAFLAAISPYNNIRAGVKYPEPLVWTTTKDDRVGPQHARKFAAKLAALHIPYLFFEYMEGGHSSGANVKERSFEAALEFTYLARQLME
ncbi:MAG: prolyl oligopeptidase family serine peptidase [Candidatus Velthaea sp.]